MKKRIRISFLMVLAFSLLPMIPVQLMAGQPYSYQNYVKIPTLLSTAQYCPTDSPITFEENQPTEYALPTYETACGYPTNTYDPNYYAAIDGDSFGDTAAAGGNGGGVGGFPCGACAALYNSSNGRSVTVVIIDECPQGGANQNNCWVGSYHLDMADTAYSQLSGGGMFPRIMVPIPSPGRRSLGGSCNAQATY